MIKIQKKNMQEAISKILNNNKREIELYKKEILISKTCKT